MNIDKLYKKGLYLTGFLVSYNILEAVASLVFGSLAGSVALVGFGLDSITEVLSNSLVIWRLNQHGKISAEAEERLERRVVKVIAITFFVLGAYILYESVTKLIFAEIPAPTLPGIIIAALSVIIMPLFALQTRKIGKQIGSKALVADSTETIACTFLSLALLLGLGANYLFGFWQADPIVGLIIVAFLFREGWENWQEASEAEPES
ncbi:MAG: cation transporter [Dehalococcoidales bacterium]|nr:cation transporter [Dehalococcoidales bacterium]